MLRPIGRFHQRPGLWLGGVLQVRPLCSLLLNRKCLKKDILYHQGTQVEENRFTPTWVGALQLIILDGHLSGRHLAYIYMDSEAF